ncbi:hypothetical protein KCP76_26275 (plasmid) [Salmonella enterica subsp. enterica serovar Weltevreden]|nr:hypothetical protein KCP76_26275 [Salmonella enterica subsp. enterica serovar Weltevreden]QUI99517.1 hypothetical protein KCP74_25695 [Salmonella enterica subsp. enterica]QUJ01290.1 hypothetical protein KCP73_27020 [Salmonella enterica subsp. enterica]
MLGTFIPAGFRSMSGQPCGCRLKIAPSAYTARYRAQAGIARKDLATTLHFCSGHDAPEIMLIGIIHGSRVASPSTKEGEHYAFTI